MLCVCLTLLCLKNWQKLHELKFRTLESENHKTKRKIIKESFVFFFPIGEDRLTLRHNFNNKSLFTIFTVFLSYIVLPYTVYVCPWYNNRSSLFSKISMLPLPTPPMVQMPYFLEILVQQGGTEEKRLLGNSQKDFSLIHPQRVEALE